MPLPSILPSGPISTRLRDLRQQVESLRPQRTPGILTSRTTRGVTRLPVIGAGRPTRKVVARWA